MMIELTDAARHYLKSRWLLWEPSSISFNKIWLMDFKRFSEERPFDMSPFRLFDELDNKIKEQILSLIVNEDLFYSLLKTTPDDVQEFYNQFNKCDNFIKTILHKKFWCFKSKNEFFENLFSLSTLDERNSLFTRFLDVENSIYKSKTFINILPFLTSEQQKEGLEKFSLIWKLLKDKKSQEIDEIFTTKKLNIFLTFFRIDNVVELLKELDLSAWRYLTKNMIFKIISKPMSDNSKAYLFSKMKESIIKALNHGLSLPSLLSNIPDQASELMQMIMSPNAKRISINRLFGDIETVLATSKHLNKEDKKDFAKFVADNDLLYHDVNSEQFKLLIFAFPELYDRLWQLFESTYPFGNSPWTILDILDIIQYSPEKKQHYLNSLLCESGRGYYFIKSAEHIKLLGDENKALKEQLLCDNEVLENIVINSFFEEIRDIIKHNLTDLKYYLIQRSQEALIPIPPDKIAQLITLFPNDRELHKWVLSPEKFPYIRYNSKDIISIAENFSATGKKWSSPDFSLREHNVKKLIELFPESHSLIVNFFLATLPIKSFDYTERFYSIFELTPYYQCALMDNCLPSYTPLELFKLLSNYDSLLNYYKKSYVNAPLDKTQILQLLEDSSVSRAKLWNYVAFRKLTASYQDLHELADKWGSKILIPCIINLSEVPDCTVQQVVDLISRYKINLLIIKKLLPNALQQFDAEPSTDFFQHFQTLDEVIGYANLCSSSVRSVIVKRFIMQAKRLNDIIKIARFCEISAYKLECFLHKLPLVKEMSRFINSNLRTLDYARLDIQSITRTSRHNYDVFFNDINEETLGYLSNIEGRDLTAIYNLILFHQYLTNKCSEFYVLQNSQTGTLILHPNMDQLDQTIFSILFRDINTFISMLTHDYFTVKVLEPYITNPDYFKRLIKSELELIRLLHFYPDKKDKLVAIFLEQNSQSDFSKSRATSILAHYLDNIENNLYTFLLANQLNSNFDLIMDSIMDYPNNKDALYNLLVHSECLVEIATSRHNILFLARLFAEFKVDLFRTLIERRVFDLINTTGRLKICKAIPGSEISKTDLELLSILQVKTVVKDLKKPSLAITLNYSKSEGSAILFEELLARCPYEYFTSKFLTKIFMRPAISKLPLSTSREIDDLTWRLSGDKLTFRDDRVLGSLILDEIHKLNPGVGLSKDLVDQKHYKATIIFETAIAIDPSITLITVLNRFITTHPKLRPALFNWLLEKQLLATLFINLNDFDKLVEIFPEKKSLLEAKYFKTMHRYCNKEMDETKDLLAGSMRLFKTSANPSLTIKNTQISEPSTGLSSFKSDQ